MQLPSQPNCWSKRSFLTLPLFQSRLRQRFYAAIYQKTSGIHFIRRLLYFVSTIPTEVIFFSCVSWLGTRALPSVARGLPDWLESLRGKKTERFWGLEIECETLGDAACVSSQKYTLWRICSLQQEHKVWFSPALREALRRDAERLFAGG